MRWIILSYLILNPLFFLVGYDQRDAQQIFFQLSSVAVFACGMFFQNREIKFSKLNAAIGVLILAFLVAWLRTFNALPPAGSPRWYIAMNLIFGVMVYLTVIRTIKKEDIVFVFKGLGYLTAFCVIVLALQFIDYDIRGAVIAIGAPYVPTESIFFQRSAMGMFFANMIPIISSFNPFVAILLFIPMIWSISSAAYLSGISGLLFFLWFRKRIVFWCVLIASILSLGILFIPKIQTKMDTSISIRIPMYGVVIQDILKKPLGYGLDSFSNPVQDGHWKYYNYWDHAEDRNYQCIKAIKVNGIIKGQTSKDDECFKNVLNSRGNLTLADHPHNEYLWIGYEVGIQGLVILVFIFYYTWQRFKFSKRDTLACACMGVLICFAVESMLQFPFHITRIGNLLPVMLGFFYITTEEE